MSEEVPSLIIAVKGDTYEKVLGNIQEIKARNGKVIILTNYDDGRIGQIADDLILVPETSEIFSPLLTVIPLQLFAYFMADLLGRNVDRPRNLAKSVTVE